MATPDTFFESDKTHFLPPIYPGSPQGTSSSIAETEWKLLPRVSTKSDSDGEEMPDPKASHRTVVRFVSGYGRQDAGAGKEHVERQKKRHRRIDIGDEELKKRYQDIKMQLKLSAVGSSTMTISTDGGNHNERSLVNYENEKKQWEQHIKEACRKLGRAVEDSVAYQAERYRERMENATMLELATPSDLKYGSQNWYLSLRSSPFFKERRNYTMPVGNNYTGLWMIVTDNPNRQLELVRKQGIGQSSYHSFRDNPFYKEKLAREAKRISELTAGVREEHLSELQVINECAYQGVGGGNERV